MTRIDLHGADLTGGFGFALTESDVLYVVRPPTGSVAEIRLGDAYAQGRLVSETHDPRFISPVGAAYRPADVLDAAPGSVARTAVVHPLTAIGASARGCAGAPRHRQTADAG